MRSKLALFVLLVIAVAGATVGIVVARADQGPSLPSIGAVDLLVRMAASDQSGRSLSGSVSWTNDLFGQSGLIDTRQYGSAQTPLLASGSGRIWLQDGSVRLESQGHAGDKVFIVNGAARTAWVYDHATGTAIQYTMPAERPGVESPSPSPLETVAPADVARFLTRLGPTADVAVTGQTTVAGRAAYVLTFTPTADDTAFGSAQLAVDGATYVPLRLQVFPKGGDKATLSFTFDSVFYERIDDGLFDFTPPAGTRIERQDLGTAFGDAGGRQSDSGASEPGSSGPGEDGAHDRDAGKNDARHGGSETLTLKQAQDEVDFTLVTPRDHVARDFRAAWVMDRAQIERRLQDLQQSGGGSSVSGSSATEPAGPDVAKLPAQAVVLEYGKGFGTIWLAEVPSSPEIDKQLAGLPQQFAKQQVAGHEAWQLGTPLAGAVVWKRGDLTLAAGGMVPQSDLNAFVAALE